MNSTYERIRSVLPEESVIRDLSPKELELVGSKKREAPLVPLDDYAAFITLKVLEARREA